MTRRWNYGAADMTNLATTPARALETFSSVVDMIRAQLPRDPVFCIYPKRLANLARKFISGFHGDVLYAVKVNPEPPVLRALHAGGVKHFDIASMAELELIRGLFPESECHFMAPIRMLGATGEAYRQGVRHFAVDHTDELELLTRLVKDPASTTLLMRIITPSQGAMFELSSKFGTTPEAAADLANRATAAGFRTGLTFHVGSQCMDPQAYRRALTIVQGALGLLTMPPATLDVGGGFPAPYPGLAVPELETFLDTIHTFVNELSLPPTCKLAAEPGRALVAEGVSLVAQVVHRRAHRLYLNDGVYGSLMEPKFPSSAVHYPTIAYRANGNDVAILDRTAEEFTLYGPTCDAYDVLPQPYRLPEDIAPGDWIEFGMIGAYASAMRTHFNGFYPNSFVEIVD